MFRHRLVSRESNWSKAVWSGRKFTASLVVSTSDSKGVWRVEGIGRESGKTVRKRGVRRKRKGLHGGNLVPKSRGLPSMNGGRELQSETSQGGKDAVAGSNPLQHTLAEALRNFLRRGKGRTIYWGRLWGRECCVEMKGCWRGDLLTRTRE